MYLVYNEGKKQFEVKKDWADWLNPFSPYLSLWALIKYAADRASSPGVLSQSDAENIRTIITEGRRQKVDEMEIEMNRDVAVGLNVDGIEGVDVTLGSKGNTKYVMKIKYKYDE